MKSPILLLTLCFAWSLRAEIKLPLVFSDHMVLQRQAPVTVWGWASPGEQVKVAFAGQTKTTQANDTGSWKVQLDPMPASSTPREFIVGSPNASPSLRNIVLRDVLVGEVWFASGQSNMERSVSESNNPEQEIAAAKFPQIRIFKVAAAIAPEPRKDIRAGAWRVCSPETASELPAVAYFFAREVHRHIGVPVGIVQSSWGNTPAQAWMSAETLRSLPETRDEYNAWRSAVEAVPDGIANFEQHHKKWTREYGDWSRGKKDQPPPPSTFSKKVPAGPFNTMIAPLASLRFRGVIWYQGETNASRDPAAYRAIFPTLIRSWRKTWGIGDFPFLFVQLANHYDRLPEPSDSHWAELREAQLMALKEPNTAMAVAVDIGGGGIHPKNKQDVGYRLSLAARALAYGEKVEYSGPLYKSMAVERGAVRLHFTHADGLRGKGNQPLEGFAIAGDDRKFVWAEARVDGTSIVVQSPHVPKPVAVRYAWANDPACNLENAAGLPASPFRTDDWPLPGVPKKRARWEQP